MKALEQALLRLSAVERDAWLREARRLAGIIESYSRLKPKRFLVHGTGKYEFVPAVLGLCEQAICSDRVITDKEPVALKDRRPTLLTDGSGATDATVSWDSCDHHLR